MHKVVAIIGTSHLYQFGGVARTEKQNQAFARLIVQACKAHSIRCLAEEMSHDALRVQDRTQSTVESIARNLGLSHIYCDPSEQEQSAMGLRVERNAAALKHFENWSDERISEGISVEHRQREQCWLKKLQENDLWPCLFICGSEHAVHFLLLLQASAFQVELVAEAWDA
jgi:hypothetical protein